MRKIILAVLIFTLFLVPVQAIHEEFDFIEGYQVTTDRANDRIKAWQIPDSPTNNWYLVYVNNSNFLTIREIQGNIFNPVQVFSEDCEDVTNKCRNVDYNFGLNPVSGNSLDILADSTGANDETHIYRFDYGTETISLEYSTINNVAVTSPAVVNNFYTTSTFSPVTKYQLMLWSRVIAGEYPRFTLSDDLKGSGQGDGEYEFPSLFEPLVNDLQVAHCNDYYYVLAQTNRSSVPGIFALSYDDSTSALPINDFVTFQNLNPGFIPDENQYNYWVDEDNNYMWIIINDLTNRETAFQQWSCNDDGTLSSIQSFSLQHNQIIDLPEDYTSFLAYWNMEEHTGDIIDDTGNGNDGQYNGVLYEEIGINKRAIGFDGVNDNVIMNNSQLAITGTQLSVGGWYNFGSVGTNYLIDRHTANKGYQLYLSGGNINFQVQNIINSYAYTPPLNTWVSIMGVYNTTHTIIYINGTEVSTSPLVLSVQDSLTDFYLGSTDASLLFFNGTMDEVFIKNTALTPSEVSNLYLQFIGTILREPYLTFDSNNLAYLWYEKAVTGGSTNIWVTTDSGDCLASSWTNTAECVSGNRKQTRTVSPIGCDVTVRWVSDSYCELEENRTAGIFTQRQEVWTKTTICSTETIATGEGIVQCSPASIEIPAGCTNITITETASPNWVGDTCDQGEYTISACVPSYNCSFATYNCSELNHSFSKTVSGIAGDTATGLSALNVDSNCKCKFLFFTRGVEEFSLDESLTVTCNLDCTEEYFCINSEYEALKRIDCSIGNQTFCQNGCNDDTGRCISRTIDSPNTPASSTWWVNFFARPTTSQKFAHSVIWSSVLGFIFMGIGNQLFKGKTSNMGIIFAVGFGISFLGFALAGFVPVWVIVVILLLGMGTLALKFMS